MPSPAENIPEDHRVRLVGVARHADLGNSLLDLLIGGTSQCQTGNIAFDVSHEHRYAQTGKALCQHLQGNCLARSGGSRDQAMAVPVLGEYMNLGCSPLPTSIWFMHYLRFDDENNVALSSMYRPYASPTNSASCQLLATRQFSLAATASPSRSSFCQVTLPRFSQIRKTFSSKFRVAK